MSKKVLIRAYVRGNFGDDLFVKVLCDRYPKSLFSIIGEKKYRQDFANIGNLAFISGDSLRFKVMNKLLVMKQRRQGIQLENNRLVMAYNRLSSNFHENVYITGSYFAEPNHWLGMNDVTWYDSHPFIMGCNFGPYSSEAFYEAHREQFKKVKQISFRDHKSYELFKDLPAAKYAPDIIFTLKAKGELVEKDYYVISVVHLFKDEYLHAEKYYEDYVNILSKLTNYYTEKGNKIIFLSFCDDEGDDKTIDAVCAKVKQPQMVTATSYNKCGMDRTLQIMQECKGVIATRFHAMILGFLFRKPVLPIIYNQKMENVLRDMEYTGACYTLDKLKEIPTDHPEDAFIHIAPEMLERQVQEAEGHFEELDKVL